jgi:hypothetical protein
MSKAVEMVLQASLYFIMGSWPVSIILLVLKLLGVIS